MVDEAMKHSLAKDSGKTVILTLSSNTGYWARSQSRPVRSLDSVILASSNAQDLIGECRYAQHDLAVAHLDTSRPLADGCRAWRRCLCLRGGRRDQKNCDR